MILSIYATLGVFLILASRDPLAHRSLIWFTVWSSVVHGAVMAVQAVVHPQHIAHLWGDVAHCSWSRACSRFSCREPARPQFNVRPNPSVSRTRRQVAPIDMNGRWRRAGYLGR